MFAKAKTILHLVAAGLAISFRAMGSDPAPQITKLSDLIPESESQGWGVLMLDQSVMGNPLRVAGKEFGAGLGTHAVSEIVYNLDGGYDAFEAWVGIDDEMAGYKASSVVFQVFGDGKKLFDSGVMRINDPAKRVSVALAAVTQLKLVVTDAGDGITCDHADWAEAVLVAKQVEIAAKANYVVKSSGITVRLDASGNIVNCLAGDKNLNWPMAGQTKLAGCHIEGEVVARKLAGGGYAFARTLVDLQGHRCTLTDRFKPSRDSVHWEIEIASDNASWSTAIETRLNYSASKVTRFWTAWSDPDHLDDGWHDPLVTRPLTNRKWSYSNLTFSTPIKGDFISLPLVSIMEPASDTAVSLVFSPEDTNLETWLRTTSSGEVRLSRTKRRLGGGEAVSFAMDLTAHEADWRGGLRWLVARYPKFFDPPNPLADQMAGCAAYSGDESPIEVAKFKRMAFRINWKLSDDFPYMGMFIPPVTNADLRWDRSCDEPAPADKPSWTSCRRLNDYARYMRTNGFYVLDYFNVTEFGKNMGGPAVAEPGDPNLWKDPRAFLKYELPGAVLIPGDATCYHASVVDVGDPAYQEFILEQAQRHIRWVPDSFGICIDRLDWLAKFNPQGNDGVSWVEGKPSRALYTSWQNLMEKLGPLMHTAGKVIFINPINSKLDWLRHVDGIYTEFGQSGASLNSSALMCLRKPMLAWTYNETLQQPDVDSFFQRHLHLGAYPTAPYPWNNHCISPGKNAEQSYFDYGPLLDAMRGKKWVLEPHCVESATSGVAVNLFEVPGGYALPVTLGGNAEAATVRVRNLKGLHKMKCEALHPSAESATPVSATLKDGFLELIVPLSRGCALVKMAPTR
ncbi:MAG: NPCBM/NEW2 domain-containing protein [Verrucomicrobiota bacterium]